jgi:hypothetical protein
MEKTKTKRFEVTIQRTTTHEAIIEIDAESEDEADRLAMEQVEQGEHDSAFDDNLDDQNFEVTQTTCLDEETD